MQKVQRLIADVRRQVNVSKLKAEEKVCYHEIPRQIKENL